MSSTLEKLDTVIKDDEFLYRGIIESFWDYKNNKPSSAIYKDSKGVSVDRDAKRPQDDCIAFLQAKKNFFAICKIKASIVREKNAILKYLPVEGNIYHSEIHDSIDRIQMRGSKPKKLRDSSIVVFKE